MKKQSMSFLLAAALALPGLAMADLPRAAAQDAPPAEGQERCRGHRGHRGHGDPAARIEHRIERLTARLGLDANQQALVRQAFEQARAEHEALRAQERSPERREAHRAIMQRTMERIDSFLTPEQRATMEQMRAQMRERFEGRRGRRGGRHGGPGAGGVDPRGI